MSFNDDKSILQIGNKDLFVFDGSKYFFDFLRKGGHNSVDNYLEIDQKSSWKKSIFLVNFVINNEHNEQFSLSGELGE